jgi:hypothetical protein
MVHLSFLANILLQDDSGGIIAAFGGLFGFVCWFIFLVLFIAGFWKTFEKAGKPGWGALIPFYNTYLLCEIAGKPGWWFLLFFIPVVNIVVSLLVMIDVAKAFGKDALYGVVLLWFFNAIGFLILGFGDAQYVGPQKSA